MNDFLAGLPKRSSVGESGLDYVVQVFHSEFVVEYVFFGLA